MDKRLISVQEVSKMLDISVNTAYAMVSQRRIPFVKIGRLTKFDIERIEEWIEEHSTEEKKFS